MGPQYPRTLVKRRLVALALALASASLPLGCSDGGADDAVAERQRGLYCSSTTDVSFDEETGVVDGIPDWQTTYLYDASGRLVRETTTYSGGSGGVVIEYSYDADDNVSVETWTYFDGSGSRIEYNYDGRNLVEEREVEDDETTLCTRYTYDFDADGRVDTRRRDLDCTGEFERIDTYQYDSEGRLSSLTYADADGAEVDRFEYTYDSDGNLVLETRSGGISVVNDYDIEGRILSRTVIDAGGRVTWAERYSYECSGTDSPADVGVGEDAGDTSNDAAISQDVEDDSRDATESDAGEAGRDVATEAAVAETGGAAACDALATPSTDGRWLFSLSLSVARDKPLLFLGTAEVRDAHLVLELQPLTSDEQVNEAGEWTPRASPREPVGEAVEHVANCAPDGSLEFEQAVIEIPDDASSITGRAVTLDFALAPNTVEVDRLCGDLRGTITHPLTFALEGSRFAALLLAEGEAPTAISDPLAECPVAED